MISRTIRKTLFVTFIFTSISFLIITHSLLFCLSLSPHRLRIYRSAIHVEGTRVSPAFSVLSDYSTALKGRSFPANLSPAAKRPPAFVGPSSARRALSPRSVRRGIVERRAFPPISNANNSCLAISRLTDGFLALARAPARARPLVVSLHQLSTIEQQLFQSLPSPARLSARRAFLSSLGLRAA